jgi:hypothetical protein
MLALIAVLSGPMGPFMPAGGQAAHTVTQFSDGSGEATFYFPEPVSTTSANITLPRNSYVTSAHVWARGLPGQDGDYPSGARIGVGAPGRTSWSFGEQQAGAGQMGRQQFFSDGRAALDIRFPPGGGSSSSSGILIPGDATIRSATLQLIGGEAPHGVPRFFGAPLQDVRVAWNSRSGRPVVASVGNASISISELDPATGTEVRHRDFSIPLDDFTHIADFQYLAEEDTAAMLLPGIGIVLLNLDTGELAQSFDGPQNRSLVGMRYGGTWIAAIGSGWAGVIELPAGQTAGFNSSTVPGAFSGIPVAVDYDPDGHRIFTGSISGSGEAIFAVYNATNGSAALFMEGELPADLSAMRYLPGRGQLMFGLGGAMYGRVEAPMMLLDLSSGAFQPFQPFSGESLVENFQVEGDMAASVVSSGELVVVDLQDESYEVWPVAFPSGVPTDVWSFDFGNERLLSCTSLGELYILDFKRGLGRTLSLPGTAPVRVNAVRPDGNAILLGTEAGVISVSPSGTLRWRNDCGDVSLLALDEATHTLAAGASEDWSFDVAGSLWRFSRLNLTLMDIAASPPSMRSWQVPLGKEEGRSRLSAMALDAAHGRLFFGLSEAGVGNGLLELNLSSGDMKNLTPPALLTTSLALSQDGKALYAGTGGFGLVVIDLLTGARRTLTPLNASGLLSPHVTSLLVDEFGRLLAGQADYGQYSGGLSVFSPDLASARSYPVASSPADRGIDVHSLARDPSTMRIFLGLGNDAGLIVIDQNANTQMYIPGLFGGRDGVGTAVADLCWDTADRTILGAAGGRGFVMQWAGEYPQNVGLDIGADGILDWTGTQRLEGAHLPDIAAAVQGALAASGGTHSLWRIPIRLSSTSAGLLGLRSLVVTYDWTRCIDIRQSINSALAMRSASGNGTVTIFLEAGGGGLSLFNLTVTYLDDFPPVVRSIPAITADAAARTPAILDLGRYFSDELSPPADLRYVVRPSKAPSGVEISLLFSRYLYIDARGSGFRGHVPVTVTATDASGLSISKEVHVNVVRSNEYRPPPPAYNMFLWAAAAVLAAVGIWILILYYRLQRAKKE